MCIRDRNISAQVFNTSPLITTTYTLIGVNQFGCIDSASTTVLVNPLPTVFAGNDTIVNMDEFCLLYTSDAADERSSVDLGGRRIINKKKKKKKKERISDDTISKEHTTQSTKVLYSLTTCGSRRLSNLRNNNTHSL